MKVFLMLCWTTGLFASSRRNQITDSDECQVVLRRKPQPVSSDQTQPKRRSWFAGMLDKYHLSGAPKPAGESTSRRSLFVSARPLFKSALSKSTGNLMSRPLFTTRKSVSTVLPNPSEVVIDGSCLDEEAVIQVLKRLNDIEKIHLKWLQINQNLIPLLNEHFSKRRIAKVTIQNCAFPTVKSKLKFLHLTSLSLVDCVISTKQVIQILVTVSSDSLKSLELSHIAIEKDSIEAFSVLLQKFSKLEYLTLKDSGLDRSNSKLIVKSIFELKHLALLDLSGNQVAFNLLEVLHETPKVNWTELRLNDCSFNRNESIQLAMDLRNAPNLKMLRVAKCFSNSDFKLVAGLVAANRSNLKIDYLKGLLFSFPKSEHYNLFNSIMLDASKQTFDIQDTFEIVGIESLKIVYNLSTLPLGRLQNAKKVVFSSLHYSEPSVGFKHEFPHVADLTVAHFSGRNGANEAKCLSDLFEAFPRIERFTICQRFCVPCWISAFIRDYAKSFPAKCRILSMQGMSTSIVSIVWLLQLGRNLQQVELLDCIFSNNDNNDVEELSHIKGLLCRWKNHSHVTSFAYLLKCCSNVLCLQLENMYDWNVDQLLLVINDFKSMRKFRMNGEFQSKKLIRLTSALEQLPNLTHISIYLHANLERPIWEHLFDSLAKRAKIDFEGKAFPDF